MSTVALIVRGMFTAVERHGVECDTKVRQRGTRKARQLWPSRERGRFGEAAVVGMGL